jgi:hypothetical protein
MQITRRYGLLGVDLTRSPSRRRTTEMAHLGSCTESPSHGGNPPKRAPAQARD